MCITMKLVWHAYSLKRAISMYIHKKYGNSYVISTPIRLNCHLIEIMQNEEELSMCFFFLLSIHTYPASLPFIRCEPVFTSQIFHSFLRYNKTLFEQNTQAKIKRTIETRIAKRNSCVFLFHFFLFCRSFSLQISSIYVLKDK